MNIRKKFSGQFIIVVIFIIVLISSMITGFIFQLNKAKEYKSQISNLNKQIKDIDDEINKVKQQQSINNKEDLESVARNRLNMIKSNEIVYIDMRKEDN